MNAQEKKRIVLSLRSSGRTTAEIAEELNLPLNTVKSICRRNSDSSGPESRREGIFCRECGRKLEHGKSRPKSFCSDQCRWRWWNRQRSGQVFHLKCQYCGREFVSAGNRYRRYCGRDCYNRSRYGEGLP